MWFLTYQKIIEPLSSESCAAWHEDESIMILQSFKMSATTCPTTQCHIPEDLNPQQFFLRNSSLSSMCHTVSFSPVCLGTRMYVCMCGFKTPGDAFRLPYSIAFGCSIRPFLVLFHTWLYISHLSKFFRDTLFEIYTT